jgi:hypothetical protein
MKTIAIICLSFFCLTARADEPVAVTIALTPEQSAWLDTRRAESNRVHGVTLTSQQLLADLTAKNIAAHAAADAARARNAAARALQTEDEREAIRARAARDRDLLLKFRAATEAQKVESLKALEK